MLDTRVRRARLADTDAILALWQPFVEQGALLPRTRESVRAGIRALRVIEAGSAGFDSGAAPHAPFGRSPVRGGRVKRDTGSLADGGPPCGISRTLRLDPISEMDSPTVADAAGRIVAAGGIRFFDGEARVAEIQSLAVLAGLQGSGLGRQLVQALLRDARRHLAGRVIALTHSPAFFQRLGFSTGNIASFPQKFAADCLGCPKRAHCQQITVVFAFEHDFKRTSLQPAQPSALLQLRLEAPSAI